MRRLTAEPALRKPPARSAFFYRVSPPEAASVTVFERKVLQGDSGLAGGVAAQRRAASPGVWQRQTRAPDSAVWSEAASARTAPARPLLTRGGRGGERGPRESGQRPVTLRSREPLSVP